LEAVSLVKEVVFVPLEIVSLVKEMASVPLETAAFGAK
jgi:hypothetical protein